MAPQIPRMISEPIGMELNPSGRGVPEKISNLLNPLPGFFFIGTGFLTFYAVGWFHLRSFPLMCLLGSFLILMTVWITYLIEAKDFHIGTKHNFLIFFILTIALGIALRICWLIFVPPVQLSDFDSYLDAARRLTETGTYYYPRRGGHILYAWRPPGYPFFLTGWIFLFGDFPLIPFVSNTIFYILTSWIVSTLVASFSRKKEAGLVAAAFLALSPSYVAVTGLASSEPLSLLLFTAIVWAFFAANEQDTTKHRWLWSIGTGLLTGYGALVKPPFLCIPLLWILYLLMVKRGKGIRLRNIALAILSMLIIVIPWTIRNYSKLGGFVAISSNGGYVFYRANNSVATGSYNRNGARDLDFYMHDEVLWSQKGYEWGRKWIEHNPGKFLKLMMNKLFFLLGDDTSSIYWTLARGHGLTGMAYATLTVLANLWWVLMWILAICGTIRNWQYFTQHASGGYLLLMTMFFVVVHSVFESHSRYHMPMIGLLSILLALATSPVSPESAGKELPKDYGWLTFLSRRVP